MNFKKPVLFGVILAIVVFVATTAAWMVNPAYVDIAALITVIVLTLVLTKLYVGKVSVATKDMLMASIIWLIIAAVFDVAMVVAMNLNFVTYYSNVLIYVGYVLIIVLALVGHRLFGAKTAATAAPAEAPAK